MDFAVKNTLYVVYIFVMKVNILIIFFSKHFLPIPNHIFCSKNVQKDCSPKNLHKSVVVNGSMFA